MTQIGKVITMQCSAGTRCAHSQEFHVGMWACANVQHTQHAVMYVAESATCNKEAQDI